MCAGKREDQLCCLSTWIVDLILLAGPLQVETAKQLATAQQSAASARQSYTEAAARAEVAVSPIQNSSKITATSFNYQAVSEAKVVVTWSSSCALRLTAEQE